MNNAIIRPTANPTIAPAATPRLSIFCSVFVISPLLWRRAFYHNRRSNCNSAVTPASSGRTRRVSGGWCSSFPFEYLYWEDQYPGSTRFTRVRAKIEGSDGWLFNQSTIARAAVHTDAGIRFQRSVPMARGEALVVEEGSTKVMNRHDLECFIVGDPTQGVECRVEYPEDPAVELEFPELELKPDGFPTPPEEPVVGGRLRSVWQFSRPMPPYSYFIVRWRKRKPASG
ncbi:MAG TPA: hypothetical protein VEU62_15935 [Bryobacterales bacterium]|nr:hypothetical protein [Bryobacterales bacterium]